jgi:hypothetical protein
MWHLSQCSCELIPTSKEQKHPKCFIYVSIVVLPKWPGRGCEKKISNVVNLEAKLKSTERGEAGDGVATVSTNSFLAHACF